MNVDKTLGALEKLNKALNEVVDQYKLPKNFFNAFHKGDGVYISIELKENCKGMGQWEVNNINILSALNDIIGLDSEWVIQHTGEDKLELFLPLITIFSDSDDYYNEIDRIIEGIHSTLLG